MPRPLRLEFENGWYHVMNRGAGYQKIYKTKKHRTIFLELLADASKIFGIEVQAYCLMDNHYHLLIKTPRANLSRAMRHINGVYTQRFNRIEKSEGPLFRGRYKAIVVDGDAYLLQVSRYIHLNPVNAQIIRFPAEYHWSSYQYYAKKENKPKWLCAEEILSMMSGKNKTDAYKKFVESGLDDETKAFYARINMPTFFGAKQFKEKLLKAIDKEKIKGSMADYKCTLELPSIDRVGQICSAYFSLGENKLYQASRGRKNEARKIAMYGCRVWSSAKLSVIAHRYRCVSHANVSNAVKEIDQRIKTDRKLAGVIRKIKEAVFELNSK